MSQFTLGAAVGVAVIVPTCGARHGLRAALWGGVCGTLPDLDTFYPFATDVDNFTWHRGYSHSLFVLTALSPFVALVLARLNPGMVTPATHHDAPTAKASPPSFWLWWWMAFLCLVTHPLLDCFTIYGTQVFLPFSDYPVSGSTVFIIDPMFTLPVLIGLITTLLTRRVRWNLLGLAVGCLYLGFGVIAKDRIETNVEQYLVSTGMQGAQVLTTPAPFTGLVWRILIRDGDRYLEGFDSLVDGSHALSFQEFPTGATLLSAVGTSPDIDRLRWFSHGHYVVTAVDDTLQMCDQRMGLLDRLVFCFKVGQKSGELWLAVSPAQRVVNRRGFGDIGQFMSWMWKRLWQPLPAQTLTLE